MAAGLARGEAAYAPLSFTSSRIGLRDVQLKRALGVGTFGKVWFCLHQGQPYALKQIAKAQVVRKGLVQHVKRERDVMAECASTRFLVKLAASFQDSQSLYLMMELITGGELFYYLQSLNSPLSEGHARFYVACVCEAFTFLHSRFYIYRDLKPENLLLCSNGYLKVADFSFVKRLRGGKTQTLCGTPAYLAPEQIVRAGHDRAVDWWALGVLTYELLAGMSPFYHDDDMTMYKRIMDVKCVLRGGGGGLGLFLTHARAPGTPSCRPPAPSSPSRPKTWCALRPSPPLTAAAASPHRPFPLSHSSLPFSPTPDQRPAAEILPPAAAHGPQGGGGGDGPPLVQNLRLARLPGGPHARALRAQAQGGRRRPALLPGRGAGREPGLGVRTVRPPAACACWSRGWGAHSRFTQVHFGGQLRGVLERREAAAAAEAARQRSARVTMRVTRWLRVCLCALRMLAG